MQQIVTAMTAPSQVMTACMLLGLMFLFFGKTRKGAVCLLAFGATLYMFFGIGPVSYWLLGRLEHRYPPVHNLQSLHGIDSIVILSGYAVRDMSFPISSAVNCPTAFRLVEGARLWQFSKEKRIWISGNEETTGVMRQFLVCLGIPPGQITLETESNNTYENARNLKQEIGDRSFVLVTSAGHMPRAMAIFHRLGMKPLPAPTDFYCSKNPVKANFFPSPFHHMCSDLAVHEYLAMLWYRLRGRI